MERQPHSIFINFHSKHSLPRCFSVIPTTTIIAKGDSAASNHYFALRDSDVLDDVHFDGPPTSVLLPDSSSLDSVANGHLPLSSSLTPTSKKTTVFPNLQSRLSSLGDGLWDIPLPQTRTSVPRLCPNNIFAPSMNVILRKIHGLTKFVSDIFLKVSRSKLQQGQR